MNLLEIQRIYAIHKLFALHNKVNSKILAERLNISRATVFRGLATLKKIGAPICYNYTTKTHYYEANFRLSLEDLVNKL
jgi:predicted DNA-binding transcriptional regulator YafY